jgi:hypothetical protein
MAVPSLSTVSSNVVGGFTGVNTACNAGSRAIEPTVQRVGRSATRFAPSTPENRG